ncbi:MAG: hypothetical protein AB1938_13570 [Myxococcota bacterium]
MKHPVSDEAQEQLDRWSARAQRLFTELLEDAGSDLQRELLQRAVAAAHTPGEVHAFADEIRGLSDEELYEACTLEDSAPEDYTVAQLLRAEADPLFAFELKGGTIEPNEDETRELAPTPEPKVKPTFDLPAHDALAHGLSGKKKAGFEAESADARAKAMDWGALGSAPPPPSQSHVSPAPSSGRLLEDLLAEATRGLSVAWREHDVDTQGGMSLADAIASAAGALARGLPVPCAIGPAPGQHRRFVLMLQTNTSGKTRAWQLYDPLTQELVWTNEGDLLAKAELPFANKVNRRLTRIVLPQSLKAAF